MRSGSILVVDWKLFFEGVEELLIHELCDMFQEVSEWRKSQLSTNLAQETLALSADSDHDKRQLAVEKRQFQVAQLEKSCEAFKRDAKTKVKNLKKKLMRKTVAEWDKISNICSESAPVSHPVKVVFAQ